MKNKKYFAMLIAAFLLIPSLNAMSGEIITFNQSGNRLNSKLLGAVFCCDKDPGDDVLVTIIGYLKQGADINTKDRSLPEDNQRSLIIGGCPPLKIAVQQDNLKLAKLFVEHGADINPEIISWARQNSKTANYLANAQNYFTLGDRITTAQDPKTIPNYLALAIVKRDMADIRTILQEYDHANSTINMKYYANLAHYLKAYDIEQEFLVWHLEDTKKRPQTKFEHQAVMQLVKLQPGNTISRNFNDMNISFK